MSARTRVGTRSRYRLSVGQTFSQTPAPSCPAGQHWVDDAVAPIRGLGRCVPNTHVALTLHRAATAPPSAAHVVPLTLPQPAPATASAPPRGGDFAPAPAPAPSVECPPVWPWWWLLIAGGLGAGLGVYMQQNQKATKKNARRVLNAAGGRILNRASDAAIARFVG